MSERDERYEDVDTSHLDDVEDGCGCTEMWEHTSEGRSADHRETDERASGEATTREHREADAADAADGDEAVPERSD